MSLECKGCNLGGGVVCIIRRIAGLGVDHLEEFRSEVAIMRQLNTHCE